MCDFSKGFILCTCVPKAPAVHNKKSRRFKNKSVEEPEQFTWVLLRYSGPNPSSMEGQISEPDWELGKGLTNEYVLENLNAKNCFDFDYTPAERDCLTFRRKRNASRLEFIYRDGSWHVGHYNPFEDLVERIGSGSLKEVK